MSKKKLNRGGIAWRCMFLITAKRWLLVDRLSTLWLFGLSIERKLIFALSITQTCMPNCLYLWRHIIRIKSVLDCIRTFSYKVSLLQVFTVFSNNYSHRFVQFFAFSLSSLSLQNSYTKIIHSLTLSLITLLRQKVFLYFSINPFSNITFYSMFKLEHLFLFLAIRFFLFLLKINPFQYDKLLSFKILSQNTFSIMKVL